MPSAQSAAVMQFDVQAPSVQRYGSHPCASGAPQAPSPSQVRAISSVLPEQVAAPQTVFAENLEHPPKPSQTPVVPQVD